MKDILGLFPAGKTPGKTSSPILMNDVLRSILDKILSGEIKDERQLSDEKLRVAGKLKLHQMIKNSELLKCAEGEERKKVLSILRRKPIRTVSGVAVVAVMTKPTPCPHGVCLYCPRGENAPQSYTGGEPASMRGIQNEYDPYTQVEGRLEQLKMIGHDTSKVELIVMGGTFPAQDVKYQEWFVKRCLEAMTQKKRKNLSEVQKDAEKSKVRPVGITFETRPDCCNPEQIDRMLSYGATRVELGVQTLRDDIYKKVNRGHTIQDVKDAIRQLKDSNLKVCAHMMPGLFVDEGEDLRMFKELFNNQEFKPDMVKFYPTLVVKGAEIVDMWEKGEFTPYTTEQALDLIVKVKGFMPKWVRTMRIQRDIPVRMILAGVNSSNLGQMVERELEKRDVRCACIRCREVGRVMLKKGIAPEQKYIKLLREDYEASGGIETFLSFEDVKNDILIAFLRLRNPGKSPRKEITKKTALVRELHTYGPIVPVGEKPNDEWQHKGYGRELLEEAERIAKDEWGKSELNVISGIGVREYYRKLGYRKKGPYMCKRI